MTGKFKTFVNNVLCLGHPPGPDTSHSVVPNPTVTLNSKTVRMNELLPDDNITLSGDPAASVQATRP